MTLRIDELNINKPYKDRAMPYAKYFGEMDLTPEQIRERILLAGDIEDIYREFLAEIGVLIAYGRDVSEARTNLEAKYKRIMQKHLTDDDTFINWYAAKFAQDATDATVNNIDREILEATDEQAIIDNLILAGAAAEIINEAVERSQEAITSDDITDLVLANSWYLSDDRAMFNAENESNGIFNRKDFFKAIDAGFTRKRWDDMRDNRERPTHVEVGGTVLPIEEYFNVGRARLLYPKQPCDFPEEICGCRCWLKFLK